MAAIFYAINHCGSLELWEQEIPHKIYLKGVNRHYGKRLRDMEVITSVY